CDNICDIKLRHYPVRYPIPKLTTRLPFKRNPLDITVGGDELNRWLYRQFPTSHISVNKYMKQVFTAKLCTAYYYPKCLDRDRYYHMLQHMIYYYIMDDKTDEPSGPLNNNNMDECRRVWSQVAKLFADISSGGGGGEGDRMESYVREIQPTFTDIYRSFNGQQWSRFVDTWLDYVNGNIEQNEAKNQRFASLDQLLKNRRKTAGVIPTTLTLEYAYKFELPEPDWLDPRMQTLIQLATDQIILVNDLFSFEKEIMANIGQQSLTTGTGSSFIHNDYNNDSHILPQMANTVAITAVKHKCSILESQTNIIRRIEQLESEILKLVIDWETGGRQSLPLSPGARQFINGLLYMVGGNCRYSLGCDRYNNFMN
ncbi:uncharacterized protein LOC128959391, partial [Oppia nitens]|uniref:uncharacterized protein LOC128959391 n=1 Tax=Oppia nitens TaxID=1686743 RepID=UPI0023DA92FC